MLFEDRDKLLRQLDAIAKSVGVPAMVIGGAALSRYNYNRATEDIDIVTMVDDAKKLGDMLNGRRDFQFIGHSSFRHSSGVNINFCPEGVVAGHHRFPKPESDIPGLHFVSLPRLLAMKIQAKRLKDRGDYAELVKRNDLTLDFIKENVWPLLSEMDRQWAVSLWQEAKEEAR